MANNCKCPICGKEFHACSSCGLVYSWESTYCCEECWKKSNGYIYNVTKFRQFLDTLTKEQIEIVSFLIFELSDDYCWTFEAIIENKLATMV